MLSASQSIPSCTVQAGGKCAGVSLLSTWDPRSTGCSYPQRAKRKLPLLTHLLTQGPAQPRGTGFAEQAAIQYFVFCSLFNVWPQAKPCSEYRTGAFLTAFLTGSPRAVTRQLTSLVYCQASLLSKTEAKEQENQSCSFLSLQVPLQRPPGAWFSGPLYMFKAQLLLMALKAVHHQHFCSSNPRLMPWKKKSQYE